MADFYAMATSIVDKVSVVNQKLADNAADLASDLSISTLRQLIPDTVIAAIDDVKAVVIAVRGAFDHLTELMDHKVAVLTMLQDVITVTDVCSAPGIGAFPPAEMEMRKAVNGTLLGFNTAVEAAFPLLPALREDLGEMTMSTSTCLTDGECAVGVLRRLRT